MHWLTIPAFLALLPLVVAGVRYASVRWDWPAEMRRKAVHMAMGLAVLAFPWLFDSVLPVAVLCVLSLALLGWIRHRESRADFEGVAVLHGVGRASLGDVLFPLAVVVVFWISLRHGGSEARVMYLVPILILTVADAAGALVGTRYGVKTFASLSGWKSVEGCLTFFFSAFLSAHIPILLMTDTGRAESLLIACILALVVMMFEAISTRGLDNIIVPLAAVLLLDRFLDLDTAALAWRLLFVAVLFALVFGMRRSSSLDGGALLGAVLFGYGCWALGDWRFVIPPIILFAEHLWVTRKLRGCTSSSHKATGKMPHAIALGRLPVAANSPGSPGSADVLVGMANEQANEEAVSDEPLASHSQANEDVGAPRKPARMICAGSHPARSQSAIPKSLKASIASTGTADLRHDLLPVLAVGLALLPWPALAIGNPAWTDAALAAFVCGTAAHLAMFNLATRVFVANRRANTRMKNLSSIKAAVFIGIPGWLLVTQVPWVVMPGVLIVFLILRIIVEPFARLARDPAEGDHHPTRWIRQGLLALFAGLGMIGLTFFMI